jgi:hypothetical protein
MSGGLISWNWKGGVQACRKRSNRILTVPDMECGRRHTYELRREGGRGGRRREVHKLSVLKFMMRR